jgi:NAD-dependent deacetylase
LAVPMIRKSVKEEYDARIEQAAVLVLQARTVIAFSGAGISTESGLSDFRSPGGLWDRYRTVTYHEFMTSEEARAEYWRMRRELIPGLLAAKPNPAHFALAKFQEMGRLQAVITQNIDGLHQAAGCDPVIELHGTIMSASCMICRERWPIEMIRDRLEEGEAVPRCKDCGGLIKPDTISFGQAMPEREMAAAFDWAKRCDLLLMIGSSLEIRPASLVPVAAAEAGAKLVYVNRSTTPSDSLAAARFTEAAGKVLTDIVEIVCSPD